MPACAGIALEGRERRRHRRRPAGGGDETERCRVWQRKFGQPPQTPEERAKQVRFLQYRGFSSEAIRRACADRNEYTRRQAFRQQPEEALQGPDGRRRRLLRGRQRVVGLLGPNGAGKTTCFYMIVGLVAADGGESYRRQPPDPSPMHQARLGLSYLPQEASVFRKLNVEENIRPFSSCRSCPRPR
jgi:DNA-binding transcriptional MerR regulator